MTRRVILDTSHFQGNVDFVALKARYPELAGAIVKLTEGQWQWTNPEADEQVASAHQAFGAAVGGYMFEHPGFADQSDAQLFLNRAAGKNLGLGAWLDCEVSDGVPASDMLRRLLGDANYIAKSFPMKTGFYTADWWWGPNTVGSVQANMQTWPLWVAGYTAQLPQLPAPWRAALLWQYTDNYMGLGIDASIFLGSDAQWAWLVGQHVPTPAPPLPPVHEIAIEIQRVVHAVADGVFGPDTDKRCEAVRAMRMGPAATGNRPLVKYLQEVMAFGPSACDGLWGPITQSHWTQTVKGIQAALRVGVDGVWGSATDVAYLKEDPLR